MSGGASPQRPAVVGLLADPDLPADLAQHLEEVLPGALSRMDDGREWQVEAEVHLLAGFEQQEAAAILRAVAERQRRHQWDMVIALTDLPRRAGTRAVVADLCPADSVALASVPALGAFRLRRRTLAVVVRLVLELAGAGDAPPGGRRGLNRLDRVVDTDVHQLVLPARLGRWRLLGGMVRANRPWRLVSGLSGALLAAFAASAFCLFSDILWQLADQLGALRLSLITVVSIGAMVVYLVMRHGLWEHPLDSAHRKLARLYNVATAATLTLGVSIFYLALLASLAVLTPFLLTQGIVAQSLGHATTWTDYAGISWLTASVATVSGALGSGTEDEDSVRRAAYGIRQRARSLQDSGPSTPGPDEQLDT
jgi:hypothetical protein